ncbi:hypothetical protein L4D00_14950 [Photobacterium swingsii]|uniref:hypothetical protein n=1 Tax=Photobacterium swingsii TaxID=680026 RepID=UPI003D12F769
MTTPILSDADYIVSDVSVSHSTPNFHTESLNMVSNTMSRGLHQLEVQFKVHLVNADDIKRFQALMLNIRGRLNPFKLSLQDQTDGKGQCNPLYTNAKPLLSNALAIGNNKMVLSGISGTIKAGSMFHFPNDAKVYVLLEDAKNNQTVSFFPSTRQAHEVKERLNFSVEPLLRLEDDSFKLTYSNASEITLNAREVL